MTAAFGRSRLLKETFPLGIVHVPLLISFPLSIPGMAPAVSEGKWHSNFGLLLSVTLLSEQLSMPLKRDLGQKEFACVSSILNVRIRRKLTRHGIDQNCSYTTGCLCDCSCQGKYLPVIQFLYNSCAGRCIDISCI